MRRNVFCIVISLFLCALALITIPSSAGATPGQKKPGRPTSLVVTPVHTAIVASWAAPKTNGGSTITGYEASVTPGRETCVVTGTTCLATGLKNGKKYRLKVRAINGVGAGAPAELSRIVPTTTPDCAYVGPYANLEGCNLSYINESGVNLTEADLNDLTDLQGTYLGEANLTNASFDGANVQDVNFYGADIQGVEFSTSDDFTGIKSGGVTGTPAALPTGWNVGDGYLMGPGVNLSYIDLSNVVFPAADLTNADFQGDNLSNDDLTAVTSFDGTNLQNVDFYGADIQGVDFSTNDFTGITSGGVTGTPAALPTGWNVGDGYLMGPGVNLSYIDLSNVVFPAADLTNADFQGDNLSNDDLTAVTSFDGTNLQNVDFYGADIQGVDFSTNDFTGITSGGVTGTPAALPSGWAVGDGYLMGPGVNLSYIDLSNVVFPAADLTNADFQGDNLSGTTLTSATTFSGTNFDNVDFSGADLAGADLSSADLASVTWSNTTCPDTSNSDTNGSSPPTCIGYGI